MAWFWTLPIIVECYVCPQNAFYAGCKAVAWGNCLCLAQGVLYDRHLYLVLIDKALDHCRCNASFNIETLHGSRPDAATFNFAQFIKVYAEAEAPANGMVDLVNIITYPYDPLIRAFQKCVQPSFGGRASVHADSGI